MALIERYIVVAAGDRSVASGETIKEGQIVSLNGDGEVVLQGALAAVPYGIAGDTKNTARSSMPGIDMGVPPAGAGQSWQNRVSDYFDETKSSGKMTVYHSGGEFWTDMFTANVTSSIAPMTALTAENGMLNSGADTQSSGMVARLLEGPTTVMSGVPGTDVNGDQALTSENNNEYVLIKLEV